MGVRDDGKPDRRHVKRRDEGEMIRVVRKLEQERDSGHVRKPGRAWTLEQWLTHWLTTVELGFDSAGYLARQERESACHVVGGGPRGWFDGSRTEAALPVGSLAQDGCGLRSIRT